MKTEKITLQEIWKENGINFTIMSGGYVDNAPKPLKHNQVNHRADDDELLLPTGMTLEDEDEKKQKQIQRNISEEEPLYPIGINPK